MLSKIRLRLLIIRFVLGTKSLILLASYKKLIKIYYIITSSLKLGGFLIISMIPLSELILASIFSYLINFKIQTSASSKDFPRKLETVL